MKLKNIFTPVLIVVGIVVVVMIITLLAILAYKYYVVFSIIGGAICLVLGLVYAFLLWISRFMKDDKHYSHR